MLSVGAICGRAAADRSCSSIATVVSVVRIAQRELRNRIGAILRRAEQGERFTITVSGRPVAELGPLPRTHTPTAPERLDAVLAETPVDAAWAAELRALRDADAAAARDPWTV